MNLSSLLAQLPQADLGRVSRNLFSLKLRFTLKGLAGGIEVLGETKCSLEALGVHLCYEARHCPWEVPNLSLCYRSLRHKELLVGRRLTWVQFEPDQPLVHVVWVGSAWTGLKLSVSHTTLILAAAG